MSVSEIDAEIARLQAEKAALLEKSKTDRDREQRDTIIKSHPFFKKLRSTLLEYNGKQTAQAEKTLHTLIDKEIDQQREDFYAHLRGEIALARAEAGDSGISVYSVSKTVNKIIEEVEER